jgi:hypothetical protein
MRAGPAIAGQSGIHMIARRIKFRSLIRAMVSWPAGKSVRQVARMPFLPNLFQLDGVFIVQTSGDAVEDEDRQQAKDILESAHDDSFE